MRQRLEGLRAEHLIDEGCVCPVALQGDRAGPRDTTAREIAVTAVIGIATGVPAPWSEPVRRGPRRRSTTRPKPKKVGAAAALSRLAA